MSRRRTDEDRARHHEAMRQHVNAERSTADWAAAHFACDDPLHPYGEQVFRDWIDFVERVARPLVEADGNDDEVEQAAMALYRKASPYFICTSMLMAARRAGVVK